MDRDVSLSDTMKLVKKPAGKGSWAQQPNQSKMILV